MENTNKNKFETLFSKVVNKTGKDGTVYGSRSVKVKSVTGEDGKSNKYIEITQEKRKFLNGQTTVTSKTLTLDPKDKEFKEALAEAYKI
jgi:hypothetical protein